MAMHKKTGLSEKEARMLREIEDALGTALMNIDDLVGSRVELSTELLQFADRIEWQLQAKDSWVRNL